MDRMSCKSKKKNCQYSKKYLKFGFILATHDERSSFCLLFQQCFSNELMKLGDIEVHFKLIHSACVNSNLNYLVFEGQVCKKINSKVPV